MRTQIMTGVLVALGVASSATHASTLTPLTQERNVSTFVILPQCLGDDFDDDAATDFNPFNGAVESLLGCDFADASAAAEQQSQIDASLVTASGGSASDAFAVNSNTIHAIASSHFLLTFQLDDATQFNAGGGLTAVASNDPIVVLSGAGVSLVGPGNVEVFEVGIQPGPSGELQTLPFSESGVLAPGQYTLRADSGAVIDNTVPPARSAASSFQLTMTLSTPGDCPGDVNGDGVVGVLDLLDIILAWGPCGTCPADLNDDGVVNVVDLIGVITGWGACP